MRTSGEVRDDDMLIFLPAVERAAKIEKGSNLESRHSVLDTESIFYFKVMPEWIPDQVRDDGL